MPQVCRISSEPPDGKFTTQAETEECLIRFNFLQRSPSNGIRYARYHDEFTMQGWFISFQIVFISKGLQALINTFRVNVAELTERTLIYWRTSPRIRLARSISFGMMVTRLPWIAQRLVSSRRPIKYASAAVYNVKVFVNNCWRYASQKLPARHPAIQRWICTCSSSAIVKFHE